MSRSQSQETNPSAEIHRVVIVGGGFAGLYAAKALAYAPVQVTLIDKNNFHLFQPMLYQVATGELPADDIAAPLRAVLSKQKNTRVIMAEVTGVDPERREVEMAGRRLPYGTLILATGSHYNYFGHPEWQQFAPSLKTVEDAVNIRGMILQAFEAAEQETDAERIKQLMTFVLIGAGTTGVELAGSIANLTHQTLAPEFREIDPTTAKIIILEASDKIMTGFPRPLAEATSRKLHELGVEVRLNQKVDQIDAEGVTIGDERIPSRTVLWTAGVVGTDAGQWIGAETDKSQRVKVNPDLTVPGHPEIFIIGDVAGVVAPTRDLLGRRKPKPEPIPGVAQPAIQEGRYVAQVIRRRARGLSAPPPFEYWDKGNLAQVAHGFALADIGKIQLSGFLAWLLWLGIHIFYLIGFANRVLVASQWVITALTRARGGRLFSQALARDVPKPETAP